MENDRNDRHDVTITLDQITLDQINVAMAKIGDRQHGRRVYTGVYSQFDPLGSTGLNVGMLLAALTLAKQALERRAAQAEPAVKAWSDDEIMEVIRECFPRSIEGEIYNLLTLELSAPNLPRTTYDVPSYRATKFVRAVEQRIRSALHPAPLQVTEKMGGDEPAAWRFRWTPDGDWRVDVEQVAESNHRHVPGFEQHPLYPPLQVTDARVEVAARAYLRHRDIDPDQPLALGDGSTPWWKGLAPAIRAALTAALGAKP